MGPQAGASAVQVPGKKKKKKRRDRVPPPPAPPARRRLTAPLALVVVVGLAACLEIRPGPQRLLPLPAFDRGFAWLEWIERETAEDTVLAFAPFPQGTNIRDYADTAHVMYWQMRHGRRMANGYSSFFPRSYRELKKAMQGFPDEASLEALASNGVDYVLVRRTPSLDIGSVTGATVGPSLVLILADGPAGVDVYHLVEPSSSR